jgi:hypothetical protein
MLISRRNKFGRIDSRTLNFNSTFSMTIKMWYDQLFKAKFGNDSINAMRRVIAQAQVSHFFLRPSQKSWTILFKRSCLFCYVFHNCLRHILQTFEEIRHFWILKAIEDIPELPRHLQKYQAFPEMPRQLRNFFF